LNVILLHRVLNHEGGKLTENSSAIVRRGAHTERGSINNQHVVVALPGNKCCEKQCKDTVAFPFLVKIRTAQQTQEVLQLCVSQWVSLFCCGGRTLLKSFTFFSIRCMCLFGVFFLAWVLHCTSVCCCRESTPSCAQASTLVVLSSHYAHTTTKYSKPPQHVSISLISVLHWCKQKLLQGSLFTV